MAASRTRIRSGHCCAESSHCCREMRFHQVPLRDTASNSNSRTTARHSELRPVVHGCPTRFNGHDNLGRASRKVTTRVLQLEVDRVNTTITCTLALRPQLDGLAIACDYDVGRSVAGT